MSVAGWHGCDHLAPVHEGDLLRSSVEVQTVEHLRNGLSVLGLGVTSSIGDTNVLAWRPVVIVVRETL